MEFSFKIVIVSEGQPKNVWNIRQLSRRLCGNVVDI